MFPLHDYELARMRQEDLLQQAEHQRLIRAVKLQRSPRNSWRWINLLGTRFVIWGQKLEHLGTPVEVCSPHPTPSPHH